MFYNDSQNLIEKKSYRWKVDFGLLEDIADNKKHKQAIQVLRYKIKKPSYKLEVNTKKLNYTYNVNFPKTISWSPVDLTISDFYYESIGKDEKIRRESIESLFDFFLKLSNYQQAVKFDNKYFNNIKKNVARVGRGDGQIELEDVSSYGTIDKIILDNVIITQYDPDGIAQEKWTLVNPFITSVDGGFLDYSVDQLSSINVSLTYDYAYLSK